MFFHFYPTVGRQKNILNRCLIHTLMIYIFLTEFSEFLHILNWIFKILKMKKIDFSFFALNFLRKNKWKHFRIWQNFNVVPKLSTLSENLIYHSCYLYISKFDKILMLYQNFQLCLKIWFTTVVTYTFQNLTKF